jgi:hypothetical protein
MFIKVQGGICSTIVRYFDNYVVWFLSVPVDGEWGEYSAFNTNITGELLEAWRKLGFDVVA